MPVTHVIYRTGGSTPCSCQANGDEIGGMDAIRPGCLFWLDHWRALADALKRQTIGRVNPGNAKNDEVSPARLGPNLQLLLGMDAPLRARCARPQRPGLIDPLPLAIAIDASGANVDQAPRMSVMREMLNQARGAGVFLTIRWWRDEMKHQRPLGGEGVKRLLIQISIRIEIQVKLQRLASRRCDCRQSILASRHTDYALVWRSFTFAYRLIRCDQRAQQPLANITATENDRPLQVFPHSIETTG